MKKAVKIVSSAVAMVLLLVIAAGVAATLLADHAVAAAVESAGKKALHVGVDVETAKLSLMGGSLTLRQVIVDNPPGYEHEKLLKLQRGDVTVETRSLLSDEVLIKDVQLDGMDLIIEQKGVSSNLNEVLKSLDEEAPAGKKLYVDNLEIRNITVRVKLLPVPGRADTVTLPLAPIRMKNLGRDQRLDMTGLTAKIILAIAAGIARQGTDVLPKEILGGLSTIVDTTLDIGRIIFGTGQNAAGGVQQGVEDIGRGVTEGLTNILTPKEEKQSSP
jgi:hypothetical protein